MIAAFVQGRRRRGPGHRTPRLLESYRFESTDEYPNPLPAKAVCRALGLPAGQCRLPMGVAPPELDERGPRSCVDAPRAATRTPCLPARRRGRDRLPESGPRRLPRRPGRDRPQLRVHRGRRPDPRPRLRDHVPRPRHARRRPGPARLHLPARERRPGRRRSSSPTATRTTPAGWPTCCGTCPVPVYGSELTLGLARNRVEEAGLAEPGRRSSRCATASAGGSVPSTSSSSRSPTRCPTASPPPSTPPRGSILHSGDFKIDLTPVDGRRTDLARIGALADGPGHPAAAVGLDQRRGARVHRVGVDGRRHAAPALRWRDPGAG